MVICAIFGCSATYRKNDKSVNLYGLPSVIRNQCDNTRDLSTRRRAAWLSRINRPELFKLTKTRDVKVCNKHFITGKPAKLWEETNPDWAPSLLLGYSLKETEQEFIQPSISRPHRAVPLGKRDRERESSPTVKQRKTKDNQNTSVPQVQNNESVILLQEEISIKLEPEVYDQELEVNPGDVFNNVSESDSFCQTDLTFSDVGKVFSENEVLLKENHTLRADLVKVEEVIKTVRAECESIRIDNVQLRTELMKLRNKVKSLSLTEDSFKDDDKKVKFYTGLPTFTLLLHIFNVVGCKIEHTHRNALPKFEEFLMTMMRLRLSLFESDLAYRFGIAQSTVNTVCDKWIRVMSARLSPLLIWPERDVLHKAMPQCFKDAFGSNIAVIIDCFEVFINRASSLKTHAETGSQCKHNTVKFLIGITPQGTICFISKGWGARASDKCITVSSEFLDKLYPGDVVLTNRGFDIPEDLGLYHAALEIPAFTKGKTQLSCENVLRTRNIANVRVHVERVIGYIRRKYTILSGVMPHSYLYPRTPGDDRMVDHIVLVCCALINFCPPITPLAYDVDCEIE